MAIEGSFWGGSNREPKVPELTDAESIRWTDKPTWSETQAVYLLRGQSPPEEDITAKGLVRLIPESEVLTAGAIPEELASYARHGSSKQRLRDRIRSIPPSRLPWDEQVSTRGMYLSGSLPIGTRSMSGRTIREIVRRPGGRSCSDGRITWMGFPQAATW